MRRFLSCLPLLFCLPAISFAYTVSCTGIPDSGSCQQCFHFDLQQNNSTFDTFVPREGLTSGQQEFIDLSQSTITATTYQGSNVTPVGNITSSFNTVANGTNATASWVWAQMKPGQSIVRGTLPSGIDASKPIYSIKYTTVSNVKANNAVVSGTQVTHLECGFFYAPEQAAACGNRNNASIYSTSTNGSALSNSSSGLCASGTASGFSYNSAQNKWVWNCTGASEVSCQANRTYCGNNSTESEEQCDDANSNDNDGCNSLCRRVTISNPALRIVKDDADNRDDRQTISSGSRPRFSITVSNNGNVELRNVVVVDSRAPLCDKTIGTLATGASNTYQCDGGAAYNSFTNTARATGRTIDSQVVNSEDSTQITVRQTETPECGNDITEEGEECDDGNRVNNDSCSNTCERRETVDPRCRVEALEYSGSAPLRTTLLCTGEPLNRTFMVISRNGVGVATYETDEKNFTFREPGTYTVTCYPDDSRENRYNSCETTVEVGAECGNGVVEQDEQCDDGNTVSGDACSRYCRDSGSLCGNGITENNEQCDDGNNSNGDYCTNICQDNTPSSGPFGSILLIMALSILLGGYITYRRLRA